MLECIQTSNTEKNGILIHQFFGLLKYVSIEESLVVIKFHCRLKNMKKLIKSSLYQKQSTVRVQGLRQLVYDQVIHILKNVKLIS